MTDTGARETPQDIEALFDRLWPILRSITGPGVRQTHDVLSEFVALERIEIPSGTEVFDWRIPKEWRVRKAQLTGPDGRLVADVDQNTLRLVNYSVPFRGRVSRAELEAHLHSRPDMPDAVPYVTSYYEPRWGFCLSQNERDALPEGEYDVVIDSELIDGSLTVSEAVLPGEEAGEVLISTYTCHPSLANNELSGPLAAAFLYRRLAAWPSRRLTYRFVFLPETIGSIAYLSLRGDHLRSTLVAGYVLTCVGLDRSFTYKRSRRGKALADRAAEIVLRDAALPHSVLDFFPTGSDERQYCSPGFDLPVGSLMRGMYGTYPEYHTSKDDKALISFPALSGTIDMYERICRTLEANAVYRNLLPYGEPNLGRRGLYPSLGAANQRERVETLMWALNLSDGRHDLLAIAERSGLAFADLAEAAAQAERAGVLAAARPDDGP